MNPGDMPGATRAKVRRRIFVRYELGTGGPRTVVIGRPLVNDSDAAAVLLRRGMLELAAEWPHTCDSTVNAKFIVETRFVNPHTPIDDLVEELAEWVFE